MDDILDIKGEEKIVGKPIGSDAKNKRNTFIDLLGYDNSVKLANKLIAEAKAIVSQYQNNDFFIRLTDFIAYRNY